MSVDGKFITKLKMSKDALDNKDALVEFLRSDPKIGRKLRSKVKQVFTKELDERLVVNLVCE